MASKDRYKYTRLPESGYIRLLRLLPGSKANANVQCALFNYNLLNNGHHGADLYEALSYAWGDTNKRQSIFIDQCEIQVTYNLHAALLRLRHPFFERVIWADALCINQDDADEKEN
ncbi:heterokaryon incompatibility protein-domain-containing protein [Lasiosphaeris hirsuta]|uniref:Heterokaryon incompatibility protein-domain-containing protein n=1 Tax=Lasiosphaeris hirsuta TaxID=260670 RepID=A0AA40B227_9PEZI|nr:heterokaryon incompatibility protein-domain-containing protein [Lasiosphaeris hirsuta]